MSVRYYIQNERWIIAQQLIQASSRMHLTNYISMRKNTNRKGAAERLSTDTYSFLHFNDNVKTCRSFSEIAHKQTYQQYCLIWCCPHDASVAATRLTVLPSSYIQTNISVYSGWQRAYLLPNQFIDIVNGELMWLFLNSKILQRIYWINTLRALLWWSNEDSGLHWITSLMPSAWSTANCNAFLLLEMRRVWTI